MQSQIILNLLKQYLAYRAHEVITRYTVLDGDSKRLILFTSIPDTLQLKQLERLLRQDNLVMYGIQRVLARR